MRRTRRTGTGDVSRNSSSESTEEKSQIKSSTRRTDEDSDLTDAGKLLQSAFVPLSRIVTHKSSSSDLDCNNLTDPHGGKTRKKGETTTGFSVGTCLPYRSKRHATGTTSTGGNTSSTARTRTRRNIRNSNRKLSSQSLQMEPIAEVSKSTVSSRSDGKDSIGESYDKPATQHGGSTRTRSRLRSRNHSVSDNSESSGTSRRVPQASKRTNAHSIKYDHSHQKSQRQDAAEGCTTLLASDKSNTFSPLTSTGDGPISSLVSDNLSIGTCSPITNDDPTQLPGQLKSSRRRTTISSDENSTSFTMFEKVSVPTESFYSKKSREAPCLRSWLLTAGKGKSSTPIASVGRSSTANSSYQKLVATDKRSTRRKKKSSINDAEDSRDTESGRLTVKDGSNAETRLKTSRNSKMEAANSPTSSATRSAPKHVNLSSPQTQQEMNQVGYLFGFENLLEPAATLLQDVSPIPKPPLPEQSRKRKEQRLKARKQKRIEAQLSSGAASTPDNYHHVYDVIEDKDNQNDIQLFEVAPIAPYSPFKIKEVTTPTRTKPEKPVKNTQSISNMAKASLPFELEEALPWRDIMEHELVIEST